LPRPRRLVLAAVGSVRGLEPAGPPGEVGVSVDTHAAAMAATNTLVRRRMRRRMEF
jgi:hypothetical protein